MTLAVVKRVILYEDGADPCPSPSILQKRRAYLRLWLAWMGLDVRLADKGVRL